MRTTGIEASARKTELSLKVLKDMPIFDLVLNIYPSSHRQCSIRIEGEATGLATFEALPIGLLPRITHTLPVKNEQMAALHRRSSVMLMEWDEQWRQLGLDGVSIDGVFDSSSSKPHFFRCGVQRRVRCTHDAGCCVRLLSL